MRRLIAVLLVFHGLAHSIAGTLSTPSNSPWPASALWWVATIGFIVAGVGFLGATRPKRRWLLLASLSAALSIGLLATYWQPMGMIGAAIDGAILLVNLPWVNVLFLSGRRA
jgi:hypothetical protein